MVPVGTSSWAGVISRDPVLPIGTRVNHSDTKIKFDAVMDIQRNDIKFGTGIQTLRSKHHMLVIRF